MAIATAKSITTWAAATSVHGMELPNRRSNDFILDILSLSRVPVFTSLVRLAATLVARSSIAKTIIPGARKSKLVKASVPGMPSTSVWMNWWGLAPGVP